MSTVTRRVTRAPTIFTSTCRDQSPIHNVNDETTLSPLHLPLHLPLSPSLPSPIRHRRRTALPTVVLRRPDAVTVRRLIASAPRHRLRAWHRRSLLALLHLFFLLDQMAAGHHPRRTVAATQLPPAPATTGMPRARHHLLRPGGLRAIGSPRRQSGTGLPMAVRRVVLLA